MDRDQLTQNETPFVDNIDDALRRCGVSADTLSARERQALDQQNVGFREPLLGRAVAAHLACREIAETDGGPGSCMARYRSAETDLEIVGMRTEHEEIQTGLGARGWGLGVVCWCQSFEALRASAMRSVTRFT